MPMIVLDNTAWMTLSVSGIFSGVPEIKTGTDECDYRSGIIADALREMVNFAHIMEPAQKNHFMPET